MADRQCTRCWQSKSLELFVKNKNQPGGHEQWCKACRNLYLRDYNRSYTRSRFGLMMRAYRNMKSRVDGVQWRKAHLYAGKAILPKAEFYKFTEHDPAYMSLFAAWEQAGYARSLTPSVDRIDSCGGYTVGNIRWITHGENSRLGTASRYTRHRVDVSMLE